MDFVIMTGKLGNFCFYGEVRFVIRSPWPDVFCVDHDNVMPIGLLCYVEADRLAVY